MIGRNKPLPYHLYQHYTTKQIFCQHGIFDNKLRAFLTFGEKYYSFDKLESGIYHIGVFAAATM